MSLSVPQSGIRDGAFVRFPGYDVPGHDLAFLPALRGNVDGLKDATLQQVGHNIYAFNTNGWLKSWSVLDYNEFNGSPVPACDLYARVEYPGWEFFQYQDSPEGEVVGQITNVSTATALERAFTVRFGDDLEQIPAAFTTGGIVRSRVQYPLVSGPGTNPGSLDGIYIRTDFPGYTFFPGVDSPNNDVRQQAEFVNNVPELISVCNEDPECAGFNTNAFIKSKVTFPLQDVASFTLPTQGMYVRTGWPDFVFLPGLDSNGADINVPSTTDVITLIADARANPAAVAFNTHGFLKSAINAEPTEWPVEERYNPLHGVYVKLYPQSPSANARLENALFSLQGTAHIWSEWFLTDPGVQNDYNQAMMAATKEILAGVASGTYSMMEGIALADSMRENYLILTRRKSTPVTAGPLMAQAIRLAGGSYQSYLEQFAMERFSKNFTDLTPGEANKVSVQVVEAAARVDSTIIGVLQSARRISRAVMAIEVAMSAYSDTVAEPWRQMLTQQVGSWARAIVNGTLGVGASEIVGGPAGAVLGAIIGNILRDMGDEELATWFFGQGSPSAANPGDLIELLDYVAEHLP